MSFVQQGFLSTEPTDSNSEATEITHTESLRRYRPIEHTICFPCNPREHVVAIVQGCVIVFKTEYPGGSYSWSSIYHQNERHPLPHQDNDPIVEITCLSHDIIIQHLSGRLLVLNPKTFNITEHRLGDIEDALVTTHGLFVDNGQLHTFDPRAESMMCGLGIKVKSPSHLAVAARSTDSNESWYFDLATHTVKTNRWSFPIAMSGCKSYVASTDGTVVWKSDGKSIGIHTLQLDGNFSEEVKVTTPCLYDYLALVGTQNDNAIIVTRDNTAATCTILIMGSSGEILKTYPLDFNAAPNFVKPYGLTIFNKKGVSLNTLVY